MKIRPFEKRPEVWIVLNKLVSKTLSYFLNKIVYYNDKSVHVTYKYIKHTVNY